MNNWEKSILEFHGMLKTAETNIPSKGNPVLMIREGKIKKPNHKRKAIIKGKGKAPMKNKGKAPMKGKMFTPKPTPKVKPAKDAECFHCNEIGHWKRNCPKYLAKLKAKKVGNSSASGVKEC
ncbi:uncharacterized protein LOC143623334 [Bidens hawaiensis]|uniref:uncharacterized protein LOC143623334 n=1 Tax=Bidens hawaiensis TaxID=980011 RepID=UPI00404B1302